MAISDKNIRITKNTNTPPGTFPTMVFTGSSAGSSVVKLEVLDDNTLSFSSSEGQIFSLDSNLTSGTIWSVNDVSGVAIQLRRGAMAQFFEDGDVLKTTFRANAAQSADANYIWPVGLPAAVGSSVLQSDTSGNLTWVPLAASGGGSGTVTTLTAGTGISFSTGSTITTTGTIRAKRPIYMTFCAGYTPITTGADSVVLRVPHSPSDGTTSVTYRPQEIHIRVETPSAGTSTLILEKYTGTSAFSGTAITTISVSGAALYEIDHSFAAGVFFTSTDKLRLNFSALNSTHQGFSVYVEMEEV